MSQIAVIELVGLKCTMMIDSTKHKKSGRGEVLNFVDGCLHSKMMVYTIAAEITPW